MADRADRNGRAIRRSNGKQHRPDSRLELAYHRADKAIEKIVDLLAPDPPSASPHHRPRTSPQPDEFTAHRGPFTGGGFFSESLNAVV